MFRLIVWLFAWLGVFFRSRNNLGLEILALRQQVGVLKRQNPRPCLSPRDRLFWVLLRRLWSRWTEVLMVVNRRLRDLLREKGYAVEWAEFNGGHEYLNWQGIIAEGPSPVQGY